MSRNVARVVGPLGLARPRSPAASATGRARDARAARGSGRARSRWPFALGAGVEREAEHADSCPAAASRAAASPSRGTGGCARAPSAARTCPRPCGAVGSSGGSPSAMRLALPASMPRTCSSLSRASTRGAQRDQERARLLAVRIVGGVDDLLRRRRGGRGRAGRSGSRPTCRRRRPPCRAKPVGERGEVGDAGVGDDQLRVRVALDEPPRGRRRSAAGRGRRGSGSAPCARRRARRSGESRSSFEQELLRPGMELDAARAAVEHARRLARSGPRRDRGGRTGSSCRSSARRTPASGRCPRGTPDGGRARRGRT